MNPLPLRILQVNSLFRGGGVDNQTVELTAGLRELGHRVFLAIPASAPLAPLVEDIGVSIASFPPKSFLKQAQIRRLIGLIRQERIQIVHAHHGRDYWPVIIASRLAGVGARTVVSRHLVTRPRAVSRWLLLASADVVAVSRAVEDVLRRNLHGPISRLHQIYGGVNVNQFPPERTPAAQALRDKFAWNDLTVVFGVVGAFDLPRGKGQFEFLEAAALLRPEWPNNRYAIAGQGSMRPLLCERIAALHLESVVTMIPFTHDVPVLMNALDVLVHPAVGTEALGLVIWEGMACGKPVVASRLDGIPEAFVDGEHGLLVKPGDAMALAQALRRLAADPGWRTQLGRAGRLHVERRFTRAHQAIHFHQLYKEIIQL
jgi:glycosyltransferase involved in cell wall biosynthesis